MTAIAQQAGAGAWLRNAGREVIRAVLATYRKGGQAFQLAPALVLLAVLPQFAQHAYEINSGMFASKEAFRALQMEPTRWVFGYAKMAGLIAAMLLIARFWATGSAWRALLIPPRDLVRLALLMGVTFAVEYLLNALGKAVPVLSWPTTGLNLYAQLALFLLLVAALLGDRTLSVRQAFTQRWAANLFILLLLVAAFTPAALLHKATHVSAFGAAEPVVWGIMLFDSLVVGLLAALLGAAVSVGYETAPSWRGWRRYPTTLS